MKNNVFNIADGTPYSRFKKENVEAARNISAFVKDALQREVDLSRALIIVPSIVPEAKHIIFAASPNMPDREAYLPILDIAENIAQAVLNEPEQH